MNVTRMKQIRVDLGMTQKQLSELSGVDIRMIQHYEQGSKPLSKAAAETVVALAKALNTTAEELIK